MPRTRMFVLGGGLAVIVCSAVWLTLTGNTGIRYSADHADTVPMWTRWVPALVGIALVRLVPPRVDESDPAPAPRVEAFVLLGAAVVFAVSLRLVGGGEPAHTLLKLVLLLGVSGLLFWWSRRRRTTWVLPGPGDHHRFAPVVPVVAWLAISYASPLAVPSSDLARTLDVVTLVVTVVVVFLVNALLEEVFYRRWLQTRWESLLGRWPAIVLTSLLWATWHIAIQGGTGGVGLDLAAVFVNQGVAGLFLGYLWSRYRRMWSLLVVHGAMNAAPIAVGLL